MENEVVRYSDAELEEFKALIDTKLERASTHLSGLQEQILEITENTSDEHGGDWVDDSSINNDVEMLNNMAIRQRMYIQDLENALVRIKNKTYGICSLTGQLIDKRRLLAVPTTTKSLAAKVAEQVPAQPERKERAEIEKPVVEKKPVEKKPAEKRITTTIIRKSSPGKKKAVELEDLEDEDDELGIGKDMFFDDDQDILYGAVSDLEDDLLEDTSSSGSDEDDDDELMGGIGMGGADDGSDDDDGEDY